MTNKLQKFMKKIGKLDKNDYTIEIKSTEWLTTQIPDFFIVLKDYDEETSQYIDYIDRTAVDNLKEWLEENCTTYNHYGILKECRYYYFRKEGFSVHIEYSSSPLV